MNRPKSHVLGRALTLCVGLSTHGLVYPQSAFAELPKGETAPTIRTQHDDLMVIPVGHFKRRSLPPCAACEGIVAPRSAVAIPRAMAEIHGPAQQPTSPLSPESSASVPSPTTTPRMDDGAAAPPAGADSGSNIDFSSGLDVAGSGQSLAPNVLGDFIGVVFPGPGPVPVVPGNPPSSSIVLDTPQERAVVRTINRYLIADNTSPLPRSRLVYTYNYFDDAFNTGGDVHRNYGGAEVAFLEQLLSVEVRGGINTFSNFPDTSDRTDFGNLRTTIKGLFYRGSSLAMSGGLGVTWPTGPKPQGLPAGNYTLAPFVGYLWANSRSDWFVQGFQQIDVPTEASDQGLIHTDVSIGYWLRRNGTGLVRAITPQVEWHLYNPYGDSPSGPYQGLQYNDVLNMTLGTTFFVGSRASVAFGLGVPISSRTDYNLEGQLQLNWFF